ncbi:hypothetical protein KI387_024426, partial [Taxus chinensis]
VLRQEKGVWLERNKDPFYVSTEKLDTMRNSLTVLAMGNWTIVDGQCSKEFDKLRFLQEDRVPNLAIDMLKLKHLKFMDYSLKKNAIWSPSESLDLCDCYSLLRLPEGLGNLQSLTNVSLEGCENLITLPDRVVGLSLMKGSISFHGFLSLKEILEDIYKLTMLTRLPMSFGNLGYLEDLDLSECDKLEELSSDFGHLGALKNLNLFKCKALSRLSPCFGKLGYLEALDLSECDKLKELSSDFDRLGALKNLNLSKCNSLSKLSDSF